MAFKRVLSVSDLNGYVKGVFDDELMLHNITVFGEIEEMKTAGMNTYLTICDESSRLSCVMFSVCTPFPKGASVELDGGIRFYQKTGKISFVARSICLRGNGQRHIAFLQLKDRLEKEGVFAQKKPCPKRICTIAVVTSETGAVIHDFERVLRDAGITADLAVFGVRVQGKEAQTDIEEAAKLVARCQKADVCVFMRGGGSEGDLEVFNTESAARAVQSCPIFTISAIGHETDITLCDLAADARAGTPSIAAAIIKEQILATKAQVRTLGKSLTNAMMRMFQKQNARLAAATRRIGAKAEQKIALGIQRTGFLSLTLIKSVQQKQTEQQNAIQQKLAFLQTAIEKKTLLAEKELQSVSYRLDAQSPLKMLAKGYARAERNGEAVQQAAGLRRGDTLSLYFEDGKAEACIQSIQLREGDS